MVKIYTYRLTLLVSLLLCSAIRPGFAQNSANVKFGNVSDADLKMTAYEKDPNASAVILYDYGDVQFKYSETDGFRLEYETHVRIKILKKDAYDRADVKIGYYAGDKEKIIEIRGFTYNLENGQINKIKLEKEAIFDEKINNDFSIRKFALPNVKEGSVIEYTYKKITDRFFVLPVWQFQSEHPVVWSEYRVATPEYYQYVSNSQTFFPFHLNERTEKNGVITSVERTRGEVTTQGSTTGSVAYNKQEYKINAQRWVMKDIPAFKGEKYITSRKDCINLIELQLASINYPNQIARPIINSWEKLMDELITREDYGGYLDKRAPIKELVAGLVANQPTPKDKMNALYNYVKNNIKYSDEDGIMVDQKMKDVLEKRAGSSAEINLLLVAMLKEAGLEAYPILLSTRGNGKVNMAYPILNKFNYNIAFVTFDKEEHLLDATDLMRPIDMLPSYALSEQGLLIAKGMKAIWVNLLNRYKAGRTIFSNLILSPDGLLKGEMMVTLAGYEAVDARRELEKKKAKSDEEEEEAAEEENEFAKLKASFENAKEYDKPLKGKIAYENASFAEVGGDRIYLNPLLDFKFTENPFKAEERQFPVDFAYPFDETYYMNFILPEGYVVEEMPKSVRQLFEDKTVKFEYLVGNPSPTQIQIVYKLNIARALFAPEEYVHLKALFGQIVAKQNEQIVLKKK